MSLQNRGKLVQSGLALFLMGVIVAGIAYVAYLAIFDYGETPSEPYLTPHSKDTTRILASSPSDVSAKVSQVMFRLPNSTPDSTITIPQGSWSPGIAFASLSKWANAPINVAPSGEPSITASGRDVAFPSDQVAAAAQADEYVTINFADNLSNRIVIAQIDDGHFALLTGRNYYFILASTLTT